jgi:hypothetical protein
MDPALAEIGIATAANVLTGVAVVATVRANINNLTGWVKKLDTAQGETHDLAIATAQSVKDLPCHKWNGGPLPPCT